MIPILLRTIHREKIQTLKRRLSLITLLGFSVFAMTATTLAQEQPITLVLFKGDVYFIDRNSQRKVLSIGQEINRTDYPWVENGKAGTVFLQSGNKLVELNKEGRYSIQELFNRQTTVLQSSLTFLRHLTAPRTYITHSRIRGESNFSTSGDREYFEQVWQQVVMDDPELPYQPEDLLTAAAWFQQQNQPARVAYLLERLTISSPAVNPFYKQLRSEALQQITLAEINQELATTKRTTISVFDPGRHLALLIGIDTYDEPSWQPLQTPIQDIRELKQLLLSDYLFPAENILVLENPSFESIIEAFNTIKHKSDETTNLLIYYAGHGYYPPGEEEGYWVPKDAGDPLTQKLFIPTSTILSKIKSIPSRHTLVIADSCFSGSLVRTTRGAEVQPRYIRDLSQKKSRQIITSGGLEPVADQGWGNNSVFAGKLLDILRQPRPEPISASELALNLRKEVKNAAAIQTPEYGRLHVTDDESGEFFFVRKDQNLTLLAQTQSEPGEQQRAADYQTTEADEDWKKYIPNKEGYRLNFGFGFHLAALNYKFSYQDSAGKEKSESDSTSLFGTVAHLGIKRTIERYSYEVMTSFGQLSTSSFSCDEEDEDTKFCSTYADTSVSGDYTALGVFAEYNVMPPFFFDVEIGGGFLYQKYTFKKLLDERNLDTAFVSACGRVEASYLVNRWFIGESTEFCARVYQLGGTLPDFENDSLSDLQIPFTMRFSIIAGYRF